METSRVIKKMNAADHSPLGFDDLVEAWNELCEKAWPETSEGFQFADIENAAIAALSDNSEQTQAGKVGNDISRMLSSFDYPTYLVTVDGRVAAINTAASIEFDLDIGNPIDNLPYALNEAEPISAVIRSNMDEKTSIETDAIVKRAYSKEDDKDATIALTPSFGRVPMTLVFVVTTKWKPQSSDLLKQQFGLTNTESEVLISFVDGYSSQDIAKQRARSHATVRTQFQSIMNKTGTGTQTELLRTVLSISDFSKSIGDIVDAANHPYRRRAEVLQEGGRVVEVTLMGDPNGKPILTFANAANYTFNASVEQALYDAGLYIVSLCAPGCGSTDPAPQGISRIDCISQDTEAVLDQLNISQCTMMTFNANSPVCYKVASKLNDRFNHVIQIASCVPFNFVETTVSTQSTWVNALFKAASSHPAFKRMMIKSGLKAMTAIGAKQFMRIQMGSNPVDSKCVLSPENLNEYDRALKIATKGGVSAAVEDLALTFDNWSPEVESLKTSITVVHGAQDELVTIDSVRRFAEAYPKKIKFIVIQNAGRPLLQSHTSEIVKYLLAAVEIQPAKSPATELEKFIAEQIPVFVRDAPTQQ